MLFPERLDDKQPTPTTHSSSGSSVTTESVKTSPVTSPDDHSSIKSFEPDSDDSQAIVNSEQDPLNAMQTEIHTKNFCQTLLMNRWVAVLTALFKITVMFLVHWMYALSAFAAVAFFWLYIGQMKPGVNPGISQFNLYSCLKNAILHCFGLV